MTQEEATNIMRHALTIKIDNAICDFYDNAGCLQWQTLCPGIDYHHARSGLLTGSGLYVVRRHGCMGYSYEFYEARGVNELLNLATL